MKMFAKTLLSFSLIIFYHFNLETGKIYASPLKSVKRSYTTEQTTKPVPGIEVPPPEILRFMRRFGYLDPNPGDSEALYHESAIIEALKNIQKYGAINQTGKLDNETLNLLIKPRCGVPDIEATPYYLLSSTTKQPIGGRRARGKRYVLGARTWTKRHIKYFIANWSLKMPSSLIERDIDRAFNLWSRYSGLKFRRVNTTAADIIVGFGSFYHGDNYAFDGPGNILAHAFYPYELGSLGGDIHFDEDENWQENSTNLAFGVDFYSVAVHEIGHSLGLAHSPSYTSIMFPYYKGPEETTMDFDDTLAMYEMYMAKQLEGDSSEQYDEMIETTTMVTDYVEDYTTTTEQTETLSKCDGDCVTLAEHQSRNQWITTTEMITTSSSPTEANSESTFEIPNICDGYFDAVTIIKGVVNIFKNEYVWQLTPQYSIAPGFPRNIRDMFPFLPADVERIDAAYSRADDTTVFFIGTSYWIFRDSVALFDSPRQLFELLGASANELSHIDAVMLWPKNNLTYLFAGSQFWRYNDATQMLDVGYPKSMQRWRGIPSNINAAATLLNGKTYFFKDNIYWLYNNRLIRPERGYPRRASSAWLKCPPPTRTPLRNLNTTISFISFSPFSPSTWT